MNKRTRKTRAKVRRGRRQVKMTDAILEAAKESIAARELSEKMRGVHPLGQMLVSVLAKVAGQSGADLLMAEAVHGLSHKTEYERIRDLCHRAADVIEKQLPSMDPGWKERVQLVKELRDV